MKREKFIYNCDVNTAIKEIEGVLYRDLGHSNGDIKAISEKIENNGVRYYPACRYMGNDDWASDVTIVVRKINNSSTSVKLEDTESKNNWRRDSMNYCYNKCKYLLNEINENIKSN